MAAYASVAVLLLAGWAALNPEPMSWAYIAAVAAFEIWLARRMAALPRSFVHEGEPPYHFSADEAQLVGRYRFYFTYPALAREWGMSTRNAILGWSERGAITDARAALDIAGALPHAQHWRAFLDRLLLWSGAVALAAAVVFFIAHNWNDLGKLAKFGLVEAL